MTKKIILETSKNHPGDSACWEFGVIDPIPSTVNTNFSSIYILKPSNALTINEWNSKGINSIYSLADDGNGVDIQISRLKKSIKLEYDQVAELWILLSLYFKEAKQEMKLFEVKELD